MKALDILKIERSAYILDKNYKSVENINKAILELEALQEQIEKMKCCENCKHFFHSKWEGDYDCEIGGCENFSKWRLNQ